VTAIDVHQHLWPERLLSALAARRHPPRLVQAPAGWELLLGAEPPSPILPTDHDPERRADLVQQDGLDGALIALSSPLGIESLPTGEAEPLLDAYHEGVQALGAPFGWWGAVALERPVPDAVDRLLAAGAAGISIPAGALASPRGLDRVGPLLERVERHGAPLFVHPGPAPWRPMAWAGSTFPGWWPALTAYVTQQHEAWHAWMAWGRAQHPLLTVVWAMLAGGAPLHAERLATRGGPDRTDLFSFYDVSSYGLGAIGAMAGAVGADRLVYGSDRPVVGAPELPHGLSRALQANATFATPARVAA
jgi:hypothetical protein